MTYHLHGQAPNKIKTKATTGNLFQVSFKGLVLLDSLFISMKAFIDVTLWYIAILER